MPGRQSARRRSLLIAAALLLVVLGGAGVAIASRLQPLAVLDGVLSLPGLVLEDTAYADGYSHARFREIRPGMTEADVRQTLGAPLGSAWTYARWQPALDGGNTLQFDGSGRVEATPYWNAPKYQGRTASEMRKLVGDPEIDLWMYSRSPGDHSYRIRVIEFRQGRVAQVRSGFYGD